MSVDFVPEDYTPPELEETNNCDICPKCWSQAYVLYLIPGGDENDTYGICQECSFTNLLEVWHR